MKTFLKSVARQIFRLLTCAAALWMFLFFAGVDAAREVLDEHAAHGTVGMATRVSVHQLIFWSIGSIIILALFEGLRAAAGRAKPILDDEPAEPDKPAVAPMDELVTRALEGGRDRLTTEEQFALRAGVIAARDRRVQAQKDAVDAASYFETANLAWGCLEKDLGAPQFRRATSS